MTYIDTLAVDAGLDPAAWTREDELAAVREPLHEWNPEDDPEGCPLLHRALDAFYDDPMTAAIGADDCAPVVVKSHVAWHGCGGH